MSGPPRWTLDTRILTLKIRVREPYRILILPNPTVNPIKLETGLRPNGAGIPYTLLLRIEAIGFPTFGLPL